jgi:hypothetical protein
MALRQMGLQNLQRELLVRRKLEVPEDLQKGLTAGLQREPTAGLLKELKAELQRELATAQQTVEPVVLQTERQRGLMEKPEP